MYWRRALLVCVFLLCPKLASAQKAEGLSAVRILSDVVTVRGWTVEQGLPQSSVTELATDRRGYLWGATFGGLFRFDGRSIVAYSSAELPPLSTNSATALFASGDEIWIGTPVGTVARLRNGTFVDSLPSPPRDQANRTVDNIFVAGPDDIWMREGTEMHRFANGRWQPSLPYPAYGAPVRDRQGNIWYFGARGLIRVDAQARSTVMATPPSPAQIQPSVLLIDRTDRIWMGLRSGLWVYESGRVRQVHKAAVTVSAVITDSLGAIWFNDGPELYRLPSPQASVAEPILDAGTQIAAIAPLHDGLFALGTLEGLLIMRRNPARLVSDPQSIPGVEVGSVVSDGRGTVFLTSECSGVFQTDRTAKLVARLDRPVPNSCTRSLLLDRRQRLWMGGDGAIRRRNSAATTRAYDTTFTIGGFLADAPEVQVLTERADTVIFGLSDGRVGRIGPDDRLSWIPGFSVPTDAAVYSIASDRVGNLWVAQMGMVTRVRDREVMIFHALHRLPNAVPRTLLPDERGGLWIGTYGSGLWHLRTSPKPLARPVPLPDRTVSAFLMDPDGRLWMSGNRGISVVPMASLDDWLADSTEIPGVHVLSVAEGVPEGNNGRPAATTIAPGLLGFASVKGLVQVNAREVLTNGVTPPVRIDSVRSNSGRAFPSTSVVRLEPSERTVQVGVSVPSYRFADAIRFRYRLVGRDDGWLNLGSAREVRLVALDPGQYTLIVEARVPGGEWRAADPLGFEVVPLFTELLWPRVLAGLVLLGLGGVALLQRVRAGRATMRAREIELRARRDAAESEARYQREVAQVGRVAVAGELTASLSHELGQPLAAIVNNAEVARRLLARHATPGNPLFEPVEQALLDVVAQGRRASQVVREFRRFLRREHGEREEVRVQELLDSITLLLRQEFQQSGVRLFVNVAGDTPSLFVERVLLQQVLVNLLQNACEATKRGGADGRVLVRARRVRDGLSDGVRISVVDEGPGFAREVRRSAFEPFVTTRADGMGMGLAISRRVVEAHGGRIAVGRLPGAGAVVSLWLPVRHVPAEFSDSLVPLQVTNHA